MSRTGLIRVGDDVNILIEADHLASTWRLVDAWRCLSASGLTIKDGSAGKVGVDVGRGAMSKRGCAGAKCCFGRSVA